jgi:hypothetical protein
VSERKRVGQIKIELEREKDIAKEKKNREVRSKRKE